MSKTQIIKSYIFKAEKDIETAKSLYRLKHFDWCLFIWHLAIEKILKAKIISLNKEIIFTHDLARLAKIAQIPLDSNLIEKLNEITTFNIEARYDDYKLSFYKKANQEYTKKWVKICEEIYQFIKNQISI
jgi:Uncharacterized conserved protein related to C-terminal domain of eukaryotic chaperone, SACSIN